MRYLMSEERASMAQVTQAEVDRRRDTLLMLGFRPAFYDYATCTLHRARHADGSPAEAHVLDGLPEEMVVVRSDCGEVLAAKATLMAGYERHGFFFTTASACRAAAEWGLGA